MRVVAVPKGKSSAAINFIFLADPDEEGICNGYHRLRVRSPHVFFFRQYRDDIAAKGSDSRRHTTRALIRTALDSEPSIRNIPYSPWGLKIAGGGSQRDNASAQGEDIYDNEPMNEHGADKEGLELSGRDWDEKEAEGGETKVAGPSKHPKRKDRIQGQVLSNNFPETEPLLELVNHHALQPTSLAIDTAWARFMVSLTTAYTSFLGR